MVNKGRDRSDELDCGEKWWECRAQLSFWTALAGVVLAGAVVLGLVVGGVPWSG